MNDIDDNYYDRDDEDDVEEDNDSVEEENVELLSLTFDALRKQLAEALPHASGNVAPNVEFSDDDNECDSDDEDENSTYQSRER